MVWKNARKIDPTFLLSEFFFVRVKRNEKVGKKVDQK